MSDFMNTMFVQFLAELADKNFEVILFLSSWGPFWGMRTHTRTIESVLVVVGVSVGFIVRVITVSLIGLEEFNTGTARDVLNVVSPMVLWFLMCRAYSHYANADHLAQLQRQRQGIVDQDKAEKAPAPAAMEAGDAAAEGDKKNDNMTPLEVDQPGFDRDDVREPKAFAFFVPLVTTLLVSASNPLQGALVYSSSFNGWQAAICLGSILSSTLAVIAGTLLEGWISAQRYLLVASVTMGLSAMAATGRMILLLAFDTDTGITPV